MIHQKIPMKLGIVIPCYNEEEGLNETTKRLSVLIKKMIEQETISSDSFICYVDDGSHDNTWTLIEQFQKDSSLFKGIKLSRNFGHQNALIAGLMQLKNEADGLISMDADLQDDITLVERFVEKYHEGYDVVYGVRDDRSKDTKFKRGTANFFYKFQSLMGIEAVQNHADYRLLSQRALHALSGFQEINLFLRGIVPMLGFRSCSIYYKREERFAGETKYPLKKMILFALDGIASFSIMPLRFITMIGFILFMLSLFGIVWVVFEKLFLGNAVQGWSSMMISIYFIGGIQVMALGIIGEYVGRSFQQGKQRPRYIIEKEI
ncbi:MAG: glycosyltransferase family 2 protein [Campylobacterota bacterium]|nr:glycosyltransferase family 2 protein [Campylobacterota bacterium]